MTVSASSAAGLISSLVGNSPAGPERDAQASSLVRWGGYSGRVKLPFFNSSSFSGRRVTSPPKAIFLFGGRPFFSRFSMRAPERLHEQSVANTKWLRSAKSMSRTLSQFGSQRTKAKSVGRCAAPQVFSCLLTSRKKNRKLTHLWIRIKVWREKLNLQRDTFCV